jgi:hypothetical protein
MRDHPAGGHPGRGSPEAAHPAASVLTERLASVLVGHDSGWRVPQPSILARRFNVSQVEVECAIRELTRRHLIRQLPDGRLYRPGPADYLITLEGLPGIGATIDPMGASIACASRDVAWRRLPEDVGMALGMPPEAEGSVIRCLWTVNGNRGALSLTYLASPEPDHDAQPPDPDGVLEALVSGVPIADSPRASPMPTAVHIEVQPPQPGVARRLDLAPGEPAITVAVRFREPPSHPVALTVAILRADLFRLVLGVPENTRAPGEPEELSSLAGHLAECDQ